MKTLQLSWKTCMYSVGNKATGCTLNDKGKQIHELGYNSIQVSWHFPCTVWGTELGLRRYGGIQ